MLMLALVSRDVTPGGDIPTDKTDRLTTRKSDQELCKIRRMVLDDNL